MQHTAPAALLAFSLASLASAQATLWEEDFTDLSHWSAEAQWHWEEPGVSSCANSSGASPQGGGAARWGTDCTFEGPLAGSLTLLDPISIPPTADSPTLRFWSFNDTEGCTWFHSPEVIWDHAEIEVFTNTAPLLSHTIEHCGGSGLGQWVEFSTDVSMFRGRDVRIRLIFDAADGIANEGYGWLIDDMRITTGDCLATPYCNATANSASPTGAVVGFAGTRRVMNNNFSLTVDDAPPNQFGHFFYGPEAVSIPVADGNLCVGAGTLGIVRLTPSGMTDAQGHYQRHVDFPSTLGSPLAIVAGSQWRFQFWFRDPTGGPSGSNFSSALSVTFCE